MGGSGDGFNDGIEEGGFLDLLSAPSFMAVGGQQQRMPSFLQPTFLQQQLAETTGSPDQQRWLADLEDAVMSIPSQVSYIKGAENKIQIVPIFIINR